MKRYTKVHGYHEQQKGSREPNGRETGRKSCDDDPSFCCTPIITEGSTVYSDQYSKATKVRSLGSEHKNLHNNIIMKQYGSNQVIQQDRTCLSGEQYRSRVQLVIYKEHVIIKLLRLI